MVTKTHEDTIEAPVAEAGANGTGPVEPRVLSLEDIVAAQDTRYEYVETPEWGGQVRIASLTGIERQSIVSALRKDAKTLGEETALVRLAFRVVAASLVDERGRHLPDQESALEKLAGKSMDPLQRIFDACRRLSGFGQEELDRRVEDLKPHLSASSSTD